MPRFFVRPPHISERDWAACSWHVKSRLTRDYPPPKVAIPEHQPVRGRPRGTARTKEKCVVCGVKIAHMAKHMMNRHPDFAMGE